MTEQLTRAQRVEARAKATTRRQDGSSSHARKHQLKLETNAQDRYLAALPKVWTTQLALKAAGATRSQLARWREEDAAFCVQERQVQEGISDLLEAEAVRRAFRGVRKPVYQGGLLAGHITEYSDQLLMFMLKAMRPERFRERSEVQVSPIVKVVAGFDPQEVL